MTDFSDPSPDAPATRPPARAPEANPAHPAPPSHHHTSTGLRTSVRVGLIVLLLVVSGGIFGFLKATKAESQERTEPAQPVLVRAVVASPRAVERVWDGFGTVRSMSRARVAAEVTGLVIERPADAEPGRTIAKGALLVAIDPADYEAALTRATRSAEALLSQINGLAIETERITSQLALSSEEIAAAERDLERTRQALDQGAGSPGEIDAKLSALRRSQREQDALRQQLELIPSRRLSLEAERAARLADLRVAEKNLARTRVRSPIAGEIQSVLPRAGDFVTAGTPVAEVVDLSRVEVPLRLPASSAAWLGKVIGADEAVSLWTGPAVGRPDHVGRITRLSPEADPASRTITVFVEVTQDPDRADRLLPGAFVQGRVRTPDPAERVVLPRRSIRSGRVYLIGPAEDAGRPISVHRIETGYAIDARFPDIDPDETEWVVLVPGTGPPAGSLIAVTALDQLQPGARVRIEGDRPNAPRTTPETGTDPTTGPDTAPDTAPNTEPGAGTDGGEG